MSAPHLTGLPPAPSPTDSPAQFNSKAFAYVAALSTMEQELNAVIDWLNQNVGSTPVINDSSTNYVLNVNDFGVYRRLSNSGAKTISIPVDMLPTNGIWNFRNIGAGDATIVPADGVDITPQAGGTLVVPQNGSISIVCVGVNEYEVIGLTVAA